MRSLLQKCVACNLHTDKIEIKKHILLHALSLIGIASNVSRNNLILSGCVLQYAQRFLYYIRQKKYTHMRFHWKVKKDAMTVHDVQYT